jgi:hypothetical protein
MPSGAVRLRPPGDGLATSTISCPEGVAVKDSCQKLGPKTEKWVELVRREGIEPPTR